MCCVVCNEYVPAERYSYFLIFFLSLLFCCICTAWLLLFVLLDVSFFFSSSVFGAGSDYISFLFGFNFRQNCVNELWLDVNPPFSFNLFIYIYIIFSSSSVVDAAIAVSRCCRQSFSLSRNLTQNSSFVHPFSRLCLE